jgi:hypothetical protein
MKKLLFVVLAILIIIVIASVAWIIASRAPTEDVQVPTNTGGFPFADNSSSAGEQDGNFLNDSDVAEDAFNPGYYYLGYQPFEANAGEGPPYLIEFIKETSYFNITILKEPLGDMRLSAEQYLKGKFPLTNEQFCSLNYTVGVPNSVNSLYSGMNLGFSFCPDAVRLP